MGMVEESEKKKRGRPKGDKDLRLKLHVPDPLRKRLRIRAAEEDLTVEDLAVRALDEWLEATKGA